MTNVSNPFGMRPVMNADGSSWSGTSTLYSVASTDATALYIGDPVILTGTSDANGVPTVTRATAGTSARVTGSVVGFNVGASLIANGAVRPASTAGFVRVAEGPNLTYAIQTNGTFAITDVAANANLASGTGNTINGSGFVLDESTVGTEAAKQLRILSPMQRTDNEIGLYTVLLVRINLPTETGAAGSTGV